MSDINSIFSIIKQIKQRLFLINKAELSDCYKDKKFIVMFNKLKKLIYFIKKDSPGPTEQEYNNTIDSIKKEPIQIGIINNSSLTDISKINSTTLLERGKYEKLHTILPERDKYEKEYTEKFNKLITDKNESIITQDVFRYELTLLDNKKNNDYIQYIEKFDEVTKLQDELMKEFIYTYKYCLKQPIKYKDSNSEFILYFNLLLYIKELQRKINKYSNIINGKKTSKLFQSDNVCVRKVYDKFKQGFVGVERWGYKDSLKVQINELIVMLFNVLELYQIKVYHPTLNLKIKNKNPTINKELNNQTIKPTINHPILTRPIISNIGSDTSLAVAGGYRKHINKTKRKHNNKTKRKHSNKTKSKK